MQVIDNSYLKGVNFHKNTNPMHDLKTNFDKIVPIVNQTLSDQLDSYGNRMPIPTNRTCPILTLSTVNIGTGVNYKPTTPRPFRACRI
jgi:hypothetical protein